MMVSTPIVSLGAGNLGRCIARAVHPVLICDNNPSLWDSVIEGIPAASPEAAASAIQMPHSSLRSGIRAAMKR
jgi:hypothetical protein